MIFPWGSLLHIQDVNRAFLSLRTISIYIHNACDKARRPAIQFLLLPNDADGDFSVAHAKPYM